MKSQTNVGRTPDLDVAELGARGPDELGLYPVQSPVRRNLPVHSWPEDCRAVPKRRYRNRFRFQPVQSNWVSDSGEQIIAAHIDGCELRVRLNQQIRITHA